MPVSRYPVADHATVELGGVVCSVAPSTATPCGSVMRARRPRGSVPP